ncbi:MAG: YCF48-related protein [Myxococcota bacterium]
MSMKASLRLRWFLGLSVLVVQWGCQQSEEPVATSQEVGWEADDLTAVAVIDATHAIVVGLSGSIYRTANAAETWQRVHSDPSVALYDVSMADEQHGWAVGDGRLLATRDAGRSWRVQPLPEGLAAARLRAVAAVDARHAVAVGLAGVRLRTLDAGRQWEDRSRALHGAEAGPGVLPRSSSKSDLYDVFCFAPPSRRCVSLGATGGTAYSVDAGESWWLARLAPELSFDPIEIAEGGVEWPVAELARLQVLAQFLLDREELSIRLEAVASTAEIEGIGRERDPEALFEILEARALDARSVLEEVGIDPARIQTRGEPPWGFEDYADDDPDFLRRYWRDRSAPRPGLRLFVVQQRTFWGVHFSPLLDAADRHVMGVAVGAGGSLWRSDDAGTSWSVASELAPHDLLAVAAGGAGLVAVGDQGGVRISTDGGVSWQAPESQEIPVSFRVLYDVAFSPDRALGLIVGRAGLVLRHRAGQQRWMLLGSGDR